MASQAKSGGTGFIADKDGLRVGLPLDPLRHAVQSVGDRAHIAGAIAPGASLSNDDGFGGDIEPNVTGILFHEAPDLSECFLDTRSVPTTEPGAQLVPSFYLHKPHIHTRSA